MLGCEALAEEGFRVLALAQFRYLAIFWSKP
jgi:hypothetical protein